jgi:uncharacterized protein
VSPGGTGALDLAELAGRLGHLLQAAGLPITPERAGRFAESLELVSPVRTTELYWTARTTLVSGRSQLDTFDRVFSQVFGGMVDVAGTRGDVNAPPPAHTRAGETRPPGSGLERAGAAATSPRPVPRDGDGGGEDAEEAVLAAVSDQERLRTTEFSVLTPEELLQLRVLLRRLRITPPLRRARRDARHPHGDRLDLRATLARAHRNAGDPVARIHRRHRMRRRRLVLLCDVSGSMEPYARAYLQLLHSAVGGAHAEAFVFATRLTRLTRALATRQPDLALRQAAAATPDWSGGTRIAQALRSFIDDHGRRGMARGAVLVIVSDGWEHGDSAELGRQMERLGRLAYRIVWINPRRANPRFEPLAGGMAAALPHVDAFVSGHSAAALDEVLAAIAAP